MRRSLICFIASIISVKLAAQTVQVPAGMEMVNYGDVDISLITATKWLSDRQASPGFFSVFGKGYFSNYSDQFHIDGYIKKFGADPFLFPVGSGNKLRQLEISTPQQSSDAYATAWIEGDPSFTADPTLPFAGFHPIDKVSDPIVLVTSTGQWDWMVGKDGNLGAFTTGDGDGIMITVSMPDLTQFADTSELRLVGWNGSSWIDLSGKPTATGNTEQSKISGIMIPGISAISIGKIKSFGSGDFRGLPRLVLFPNPISNQTNIQLRFKTEYSGIADLIIYNAIGQKINTIKVVCTRGINQLSANISGLVSGAYIMQLLDVNGSPLTLANKFIKY